MNIQSQLIIHVLLQLVLPITLIFGSVVHWIKTRHISSIGLIAGSALILVLAVASVAYHPLFALGIQLSTQQYGVIAMRLSLLSKTAWLVFGGSFIWMAHTAKKESAEQNIRLVSSKSALSDEPSM
jgi:hypothetical protein